MSELTRKAVHENTLTILRKAQEESAVIALHQHERALGILTTQTQTHSSKVFDMEVKRLMDHLTRAETENGVLRQRINELEASLYTMKQEIPSFAALEEMQKNLEDAVYEKEVLERSMNEMKENLSPKQDVHVNLLKKIKDLEEKHAKMSGSGSAGEMKKMEEKYVMLLNVKNQEIMQFKKEMDFLIESLHTLQSC